MCIIANVGSLCYNILGNARNELSEGKMYLEKYLDGYCCNLGFVRFIAAFFVIYAHSFPLSVGYSELDLFMTVSECTMSFGSFSVHIFFICSGLLVARSLEKDGDLVRFAKKRIIRVFPALWLVVLMTIFVIGPLFTTLSVKEYFLNTQTWKYLGSCLLLPEQGLPGLFENNIYPGVINGSLWTLRIEIVCYVFLMVCHAWKLTQEKYLKWLYPLFVLGLFLCLFVDVPLFLMAKKYYVLLFSFYNGMVFWVYRKKIKVNYLLAGALLICFVISAFLHYPELGVCLLFSYAFVVFVFAVPQCGRRLAKAGNLSYGIYLCAFPVQQCIVAYFGGSMQQEMNFLISSMISLAAGWLIYEVGEKRIGGFFLSRI